MAQVKICGITSLSDGELCVAAGADALGLNFWAGSSRCVDEDTAMQIVGALVDRVQIVGVFVDASLEEIQGVKERTGIDWVQLHGDEPAALVEKLLPNAYKAIRVRDEASIAEVNRFPGDHVLLDAHVAGMPGGTGRSFNWALAAGVAEQRKVTLAGGLTPDNVAEAIRIVRPFRVDVASGVEDAPRKKSPQLVQAFVAAAKGA